MDRSDTRVLRGRVVLPEAVLADGVVIIAGDRLGWVGAADQVPEQWRSEVEVLPTGSTGYILPGLVDIHCHGGGGASFPDAEDAETARAAVEEHRRHGTTTLVASLVTAAPQVLRDRTAMLVSLAEAGEIAGIHFEGPFIAAARCGAQNPAAIQQPDAELTAELLELGAGHVVAMTIAPEAPGITGPGGVSETLIAGGALPSFGHTVTTASQARAAVDEANRFLAETPDARSAHATVTHLFNGMNPMHHRDPGPIPEFLAAAGQGRLVLELIGDGTHLAPSLVRNVLEIVGRDNVALVTDAMAATGMADGAYQLGSLAVTVADGVARLTDGGSIAGGTSHLLDQVRTCVEAGIDLVDAVYVAATKPAIVLGDPSVGALQAGRKADLVITDDELRAVEVVRGGRSL